jgi:hypothetical protein
MRHCHWQYSVSARVMRERHIAAVGSAVRRTEGAPLDKGDIHPEFR